jgi:hypothetical protein
MLPSGMRMTDGSGVGGAIGDGARLGDGAGRDGLGATAVEAGDDVGGEPPADTEPAARPAIARAITARRRTPAISMPAP